MGQLFEALSPRHVAFIEAQKIYFVGTAAQPLPQGQGFVAHSRCPYPGLAQSDRQR